MTEVKFSEFKNINTDYAILFFFQEENEFQNKWEMLF